MAVARNTFSSGDLNPIQFAKDWHYIVIAGSRSPGAIAIDGIHGFERETGWDIKKGKGVKGASLTLTTLPPAEGSVDIQLWLPEHFAQWSAFARLLKYDTSKTSPTAADAVSIEHPSLVDVDVNLVVTRKVHPLRHRGRGLYIATIEFIEWMQPPKMSVVKDTTASRVSNKEETPGDPDDTVGNKIDRQIGEASKTLAATPWEGE
jgi:hypothetical protein